MYFNYLNTAFFLLKITDFLEELQKKDIEKMKAKDKNYTDCMGTEDKVIKELMYLFSYQNM